MFSSSLGVLRLWQEPIAVVVEQGIVSAVIGDKQIKVAVVSSVYAGFSCLVRSCGHQVYQRTDSVNLSRVRTMFLRSDTVDRGDFLTYRRHGRQGIPCDFPAGRRAFQSRENSLREGLSLENVQRPERIDDHDRLYVRRHA